MRLSYIIITHNRREALLRTLARLEVDTDLPRGDWETIVVDNASTDDTAPAVAHAFPRAQLIRLPENMGMPARSQALPMARGAYLCFLDDDSYPNRGMISKALDQLDRCPVTAALVARVELADGTIEAPAFPAVTLGGASIIRAAVLRQIGGFAPEFFRQAEEYDLSFRLWAAGWRVDRFEDLVFGHDKVASGRSSQLTCRMDLRNNLILVERYLPRHLRREYRRDFIRRYAALARYAGCGEVIGPALSEARRWARREAASGRKVLPSPAIEKLFDLERQAGCVQDWTRRFRPRRVAVADFSKNIHATWSACHRAGLSIVCIADNHPAYTGMRYRGMPILPDIQAHQLNVDGIVLSSLNAGQVERRGRQLEDRIGVPVLRLWQAKYMGLPVARQVA